MKMWWSPLRLIDYLTLAFDLGGDTPDAPQPDPKVGEASLKMAETAAKTEARLDRNDALNQARNARLEPVIDQLFRSQVDTANTQTAIANANQNRLTSSIWPIERTLMADSLGYYDADPTMSKAIEDQMRSAAASSYGYDTRLAQLLSDKAKYDAEVSKANAAVPTIDRAAIEKELTKDYTYTREQALGKWVKGEGWWDGDYFTKGGQIPATVVNKEGLAKAVQSRVDQLTKEGQAIQRPAARDFDAERAVLDRGYSDYNNQIGSELAAMRLYRDADLNARETAARDAGAAIKSQFSNANQGQRIELARMGVSPDSGKFGAMSSSQAAMEAAASASAMNTARAAAKQLGWAKRMDAAALGRGLPGNQATSTGLALQGTQGAQNSALVPSNLAAQQQQLYTSGMQGVGNLYQGSGNLALGGYQAQVGAWNAANQAAAQESAGFGSALGSIAAAGISAKWSDRRLKENIVKLGELPDGVGVYAFNYIYSGNRDVGVMADEVEKVYPDAVSEMAGYKQVDYTYFDDALEPWREYATRTGEL